MNNQHEKFNTFEEVSVVAKTLISNKSLDTVLAIKNKKQIIKHGLICACVGMIIFSIIGFLMGEFNTISSYALNTNNTIHLPFAVIIGFLGIIIFIFGAMCEEMAQKEGRSFYKE